jgi:hypothetical protein
MTMVIYHDGTKMRILADLMSSQPLLLVEWRCHPSAAIARDFSLEKTMTLRN